MNHRPLLASNAVVCGALLSSLIAMTVLHANAVEASGLETHVTRPALKESSTAKDIVVGTAPLGTTVTAFARSAGEDLKAGDALDSLELEVALDVATGEFRVKADANALTDGFVTKSGLVDVQVLAVSKDGAVWVDHTSAKASGTSWATPDTVTSSPTQRSQTRLAESTPQGVHIGRLTSVVPAEVNGSSARKATAAGAECLPQVINTHWFDARLGEVFPIGNTQARVIVNHNDGGSYQVALKVPNHPVDKAEMMRADGSWGVTGPWRTEAAKYVGEVKYNVVDNRFRSTDGTCQYYLSYEPVKESGQFIDRTATRPNFSNCQQVADGADWYHYYGNSQRYVLGAGVSAGAIVGVDLQYQDTYEEGSYETHYLISGRKQMCGSNNTSANADRVMEKRA